jgi:hypothetical protein
MSFGALVVNQFMISLLRENWKKEQPRDNYIISLFNSNIITSTFVPVVKPHTHKLYISRHATNIAYL